MSDLWMKKRCLGQHYYWSPSNRITQSRCVCCLFVSLTITDFGIMLSGNRADSKKVWAHINILEKFMSSWLVSSLDRHFWIQAKAEIKSQFPISSEETFTKELLSDHLYMSLQLSCKTHQNWIFLEPTLAGRITVLFKPFSLNQASLKLGWELPNV